MDGTMDPVEVARIADRCRVLGPGTRGVIWVQGCTLSCAGCVVPESHPRGVAPIWAPEALAERMLAIDGLAGITISGGEPFLQARGLGTAIARMRIERPDWTFMSYSGYRLPVLAARGPAERQLLASLDILVDGPFVERLAADLLWRGSSNQRIHPLTDAGRAALSDVEDRPAGVEIELGPDGQIAWSGVPRPGFRDSFESAIGRAGLELVRIDGDHATTDHDRRTA
jgi:anaerobic ribonucleoside-triphosphate reductase activating protein